VLGGPRPAQRSNGTSLGRSGSIATGARRGACTAASAPRGSTSGDGTVFPGQRDPFPGPRCASNQRPPWVRRSSRLDQRAGAFRSGPAARSPPPISRRSAADAGAGAGAPAWGEPRTASLPSRPGCARAPACRQVAAPSRIRSGGPVLVVMPRTLMPSRNNGRGQPTGMSVFPVSPRAVTVGQVGVGAAHPACRLVRKPAPQGTPPAPEDHYRPGSAAGSVEGTLIARRGPQT